MKHFYRKKEGIAIDLKSMYENHVNVINKYDFGQEELYQMMDRFIPQVVEEIHEFNNEILNIVDKADNDKANLPEALSEASLELLDIILYLISINSTLMEKYEKDLLEREDINFTRQFILNDGTEVYNIDIYNKAKDAINKIVVDTLGGNRRLIPNRKYHQDKEEISKEDSRRIVFAIFKNNHITILSLMSILFGRFVLAKDLNKVIGKIQEVVKYK
ncbi:hypothetical protein [Staphylococcus phage vB_StaM_SA1]|nr:hypothetical protein [Staphylococcus phage vB_StaM_SA1]